MKLHMSYPARLLIVTLCVPIAAQAGPDAPGPRERFLIVADALPAETRAALRRAMVKEITEGPQGDVTHVVAAPGHTPIATIRSDTPPGRDRLRSPTLRAAAAKALAFLDDPGAAVPEGFRRQAQVPRLLDTFWALRETDLPVRVVIAATPLHHDPDEPQWSFRDGAYPAPSTLSDPTSTLPFRAGGRRKMPGDARVTWLTPEATWSYKAHEEQVLAFYREAFRGQIGGALVRVTADAASALERDPADGFPPLDTPADPLPPRMLTAPREPGAAVARPGVVPDAVKAEIERIRRDPNRILIAINWQADDPTTDLDLWVTSNGIAGELNFHDMAAGFGRLIRDIRHTGEGDSSAFGRWELAVIDHARVNDLVVWLNAYEASGPARVTVVTVIAGAKAERQFTFDVKNGDRAEGRGAREGNPCWTRLHLTPGEAAAPAAGHP